MSIVHFGRRSRPSALALREKLIEYSYSGPSINFGIGHDSGSLNSPAALECAINKKVALETMREHDVPIPNLWVDVDLDTPAPIAPDHAFPVVGRPDKHSKGRGFWLCNNYEDVQRALRGTRRKAAATHFLKYIDNAREFRVHVMRDHRACDQATCMNDSCNREGVHIGRCGGDKWRTIKTSEKIPSDVDLGGVPLNHAQGNSVFNYTEISSNDRKKLRKAARGAVQALGLDFGAVDVLLKDRQVFVLEVNTAPRLTDNTSDTLSKYVECFIRYWS